ncbi:MAG: tRNA 2-selenouridine(34) synthase MnmH [Spirochaetales bacterium]|nr:tRNA 2-selenouridine(34) synthase MnmH [Spirochaetales bacterium]
MTLIDIEEFHLLKKDIPCVDVRSPVEYTHAHVPGSFSIPLFSDDERARIGTTYKKEGQDRAIVLGERFAEPKIPYYLKEAEELGNRIIVTCARGGLRSLRFSELLEDKGFEVFRLKGGYKNYRQSVLKSFSKKIPLVVLSGKTGCGKTEILKELQKSGEQILDLEGLAGHKGSAFGSIGLNPQPSNEMFENILSEAIASLDYSRNIWVEDESQNIGRVALPAVLYEQMAASPQVLVRMNRDERIDRLCAEYGDHGSEPLAEGIKRIRKRLGDLNCRTALEALEMNRLAETASIVLSYYDKCYDYSLSKKSRKTLGVLSIDNFDPRRTASRILFLQSTQNTLAD